jgi:hypothetical protein
MKKTLLFLSLLLLTSIGFSQNENDAKKDTTKIRIGNSTLFIFNDTLSKGEYTHDFGKCDPNAKKGKDWATLQMDIGMNGYTTPDYQLSLPASQALMEIDYARSRSFGLTVVGLRGANLIRNRLYLNSGLGINWNSYSFKNNITISPSNDSTVFAADTILEYNKYKLRATYLEVPLMLGFRIGKIENPLGIQIGVIGGFKINSLLKQTYTLDGVDYKGKVKDDFNINPFRFDAVARITYGNVGFFARYSLTTVFEENKAPDLYPFSVGISFGEFNTKRKARW